MSNGASINKTEVKKALTQADLRTRLLAFKKQRGAEFQLTALGYFGSYARGEAQPESDIDIIFETTHPNLWMTSIMRQDLEEWLDRPVDLIRLHRHMRPGFRARLEREVVYV